MQLANRRVDAPIFNTAPVVRWLIAATVLAHLARMALPPALDYAVIERFGFIAARYTLGAWQFDPLAFFAAPLTHLFLHGGLTHLLVNMAMLLAFGTPVARRMRAGPFLILYAICGLAGAASWTLLHPLSIDPLIGASGAISGMIGAIARSSLVHTEGHQTPLANRSTAWIFIAFWLIFNVVFGVLGPEAFGMKGAIAWEAHLGGFVAGFALAPLFNRRV